MGLVHGLGILIAIGSGLMLGGFVVSLMDGEFAPVLFSIAVLGGMISAVLIKFG